MPSCAGSPKPNKSRRLALVATLVSALAISGLVSASTAQATTLTFLGTSGPGDSQVVTRVGEQYENHLSPTGSVIAVLDDTNQTITSGTVSLDSTYSAIVPAGPFFGYIRADFEQVGPITGTTAHTATEGIDSLAVHVVTRLHVTTYVSKVAEQHPETDGTVTDPVTCWVDLDLSLTGSVNRRTGFLSLGQDGFTIPNFPGNETATTGHDCGEVGYQVLDGIVAGSNNTMHLNFNGAPTTVHYTGVSTGDQSTIVVRKGDPIFSKTIHPLSSLVADIDFRTNAITNVAVKFDRINVAALPGLLATIPVYAHIDLKLLGTPVAALAPGTTPGIDKVTVSTKARMAVTVTAISNDLKLTNPSTCYVDLKLALAGTVDRGTDKLKLSGNFAIPAFPLFGCGLLSAGLTTMVSGPSNTVDLNYVDGVVS